jgi:NhaP-type Na+/H+ or K+/H+ antiporter
MSKITEAAIVLALVGVITLVGNWIGYGFGLAEALPGMATLFVICVLGILANRFIYKLPTVLSGFPGSATVAAWVSKVNFLALTTPILAYAGVGIGKDLPALKETGWRIVVVSLFVMAGTYVGSAAIAHVVLKYLGEI